MRTGRFGVLLWVLLTFGCGDDGSSAVDAGADAGDAGCVGSDCCTQSSQCDNGLHCDGVETCVEGRCAAGASVVCDDGVACTRDSCSEVDRRCDFVPTDADADGHADIECTDGQGDPLGDDCDDDNANRFPGNVEVCDPAGPSASVDEDCDPRTFGEVDADGDGAVDDRCVNVDANGTEYRGYDCDDDNMSRRRGQQEFCDQRDNDCDDIVDEDPGVVAWYADDDEDGVGGSTLVIETCTLQPTLSLRNNDCDDDNAARRPGFPEFCDGVDNNCNELVDERLRNCTTTETQTKATIDECLNGLSNCAPEAVCTDTLEAFSCACAPGYMGDGLTCSDIDECATNNGGCDPLATCTENIGAPRACTCPTGYATTDSGMTCVDVDECATDNGGCGDATYWSCTNNLGAAPTCADLDECLANNGDCGDPAFIVCSNNQGSVPTCTDIDECATNNGNCGDPAFITCVNNQAAPPSCSDIDECLTNNGGCGNATYYRCTNNQGGVPTCTDINECATNNGGCSPYASCTNNVGGPASCSCNSGFSGNGTTCTPTSCLALRNAGVTTSGTYAIDPDGTGAAVVFNAYCDQTYAGGGWTLIRRNTGGTNSSVQGVPTTSNNVHLSPTRMMAIAAISTQVHIRTSGNPSESVTSNANTSAIVRLRQGLAMVDSAPSCDVNVSSQWTGPVGRVNNLWFTCCPAVGSYPDGVFQACNNASGMHWSTTETGWVWGISTPLEMYFR